MKCLLLAAQRNKERGSRPAVNCCQATRHILVNKRIITFPISDKIKKLDARRNRSCKPCTSTNAPNKNAARNLSWRNAQLLPQFTKHVSTTTLKYRMRLKPSFLVKRSLRDAFRMNSCRNNHACGSDSVFQFQKLWADFDKIRCCRHAYWKPPQTLLFIPTFGNNNMADARAYEEEATLAPVNTDPSNDIKHRIFKKN